MTSEFRAMSARGGMTVGRRRSRAPVVESLERRALLANIVWANEGDIPSSPYDSDTFDHYYGANAPLARSIVHQAIADWDRVITNFNYVNPGKSGYAPLANTFNLYLGAGKFDGGRLGNLQQGGLKVDRSGRDSIGPDVQKQYGDFGKPYQAFVTIDDDGGGHGWFLDPTPAESSEFPTVVNANRAVGNLGNRADFYSTVLREIGKAIGIASEAPYDDFSVGENLGVLKYEFDPRTGTRNILFPTTYKDPSSGATATTFFTNEGEQGLYPGPLTPKLAQYEKVSLFPYDLMTADPPLNTRDLISDADAALLRYGYIRSNPMSVSTPTVLGMTMLARYDPRNRALNVTGDPTVAASQITVSTDASTITVAVNGSMRQFAKASVGSINILSPGADTITVPSTISNPIVIVGSGKGKLVLNAPGFGELAVGSATIKTGPTGGAATAFISYAGLARVEVHGSSTALVDVNASSAGTTVAVIGPGRVKVGATGTTDFLAGPVDISGAVSDLTIDDSASNTLRNLTLSGGGVYGLAPANVTFGQADMAAFHLVGPRATSYYTVAATPRNLAGTLVTSLLAGPGNDTIRVNGAIGLSVDVGGGGLNTVTVVPKAIFGAFYLTSSSSTAGIELIADESSDTSGPFITLGSLTESSAGFIQAGGRASLLYSVAPIVSVSLYLGDVPASKTIGTTVIVQDTPAGRKAGYATRIYLGGLKDQVQVARSAGPLFINGRGGAGYQVQVGTNSKSLAGFVGQVGVAFAGIEFLDQNAAAAETIGVAANQLTVNGKASVYYTNPTRVTYTGPNKANTYNIEASPGGDLQVTGGTAADTFNVAAASKTIDGMAGVVVNGLSGLDRLTVDDSKATVGTYYDVATGAVLGLPVVVVGRGTSKVTGFALAGGAALIGSNVDSVYTVNGYPGGVPTTIKAGPGSDQFAMHDVSAAALLTLDGGGGSNTLDYSTMTAPTGTVTSGSAPPNPLLLLKADGDAKDSSGGGHDGQLHGGVTIGPGVSGGAFQFNDIDGYVEIPDSAALNPTAGITLSAWVNPDNFVPGGGEGNIAGSTIIAKAASGYAMHLVTGRIGFYHPGVGGKDGTFLDYSRGSIPAHAWSFIAATYDPGSGFVRFYINGALDYQSSTSGSLSPVAGPVEVGGRPNPAGSGSPRNLLAGRIDNASIYGRALTAAELLAVQNGSASQAPPVAKGVTVDLKNGKATGAVGGVANFRVLYGSAYADSLVGNGGPVFGAGGPDVLYSGPAAATLSGGEGDDLLVGGSTTLDPASLDAVLVAWVDTSTDAATRLAKLRIGLLGSSHVAANAGGQQLTGGNGSDAFLVSPADFTDAEAGEPTIAL